jgi:hypothetical protein
VRVTLDIEPAGKTIRGELAVEDGPASAFFGWLELIARLERETAEIRRGSSHDDRRQEPETRSTGGER